jgi:hypothetical protein
MFYHTHFNSAPTGISLIPEQVVPKMEMRFHKAPEIIQSSTWALTTFCKISSRKWQGNQKYRVFLFLLDQYAPAQHSASIASNTICRGGLTADDRSWTNDHSDNL